MEDLKIVKIPIDKLTPDPTNAKVMNKILPYM